MHGSLHLILAHESAHTRLTAGREARRSASLRRPLTAITARVAAAHGFPARAGRHAAASPRGG